MSDTPDDVPSIRVQIHSFELDAEATNDGLCISISASGIVETTLLSAIDELQQYFCDVHIFNESTFNGHLFVFSEQERDFLSAFVRVDHDTFNEIKNDIRCSNNERDVLICEMKLDVPQKNNLRLIKTKIRITYFCFTLIRRFN